MAKLKETIQKVFPKHARVPLITVALLHSIFYWIPPLLTGGVQHRDFSVFVDDSIPFLSFFIIFYVGAYLQWVGSYLFHSARSRGVCTRLAAADIVTKVVAAVFFVLIPTTMMRPTLDGGVFDFLVGIIYFLDEPVNLFPSLHCAVSWLCFRSAFPIRRTLPRGYLLGQLVFTLLVFASTVFIKQHVFVDIVGGVILAELAWLLSAHLPTESAFGRLEAVFSRNKSNR